MKPWVLALLGLLVVAGGVAADTALLTNPTIRNGYWAYLVVGPGLLLALLAVARKRSWGTIPWALLAVLVTGAYSFVRFLPAPSTPPAVGVSAIFPDFALPDQNGRSVSLDELRKDGPVVVVLFRGHW